MSKNINPNVKKMLSERIAYERKLNEKSKPGYETKRKTQALLTGTILATTLGSAITPVFADNAYKISDYKGIGYISVTEEVGAKGDGSTISPGTGDAGGVSYGLTQLSTTQGSADEFVDKFLKNNYPEFYKFFENADKAGTESFNKAWLNAYNHNPGEFERIQLENKELNFVNPAHKNVKEKYNIDLFENRARLEFIHSTAVQFGPDGILDLFEYSGVTSDMDDEELLSKLCDEKYKSVGTYKFKKCDKTNQASVRARFIREKEELLKIVEEEKGPLLGEDVDTSDLETEDKSEEFVEIAKSYLNQGTTYKMGGKNTNKLDCSGYVSLVYQDMGIDIDEMMTNAGKLRNDTTKISRDELKEGDLVFWHDKTGTKHATVFHVGIYIGDDTIVDCSTDYNGVGTRKLSSLKDNSSRYYTFGRYEELQEKLQADSSDKYLDLSEFDEVESIIEVSESVEEKFGDEFSENILEEIKEDTVDEDKTIVDEDESIVSDDAIEEVKEDTIDEDKTIADEDESIVSDDAIEEVKEDTIDEDKTIADEDESIVSDDAIEEVKEDTIDEDKTIVDEDESIVSDDVIEETKEDDNSTTDTDKNNEKVEDVIETENKDTSIDEDIFDVKDENSMTEEETKDNTTTEVKDEVKDNTTTEVKDEVKEETKDNTTTEVKDEVKEETKDNTTTEVKEEVKEETKDNTTTEVKEEVKEETKNNATEDNSETEFIVAESSSEARIRELEQKLENNLFAKLFRG